jgi:hypothetical protein
MNSLTIIISVGWTVFFDSTTKKATGYSAFPKGGKANTSLSILFAPTEAELLALCKAEGIELPKSK